MNANPSVQGQQSQPIDLQSLSSFRSIPLKPHQIIEKYDLVHKQLKNQFSFIQKEYFSLNSLHQEISSLEQQIQKTYKQMKKDNKWLKQRKRFTEDNVLFHENDDKFTKTFHLKEVLQVRQNHTEKQSIAEEIKTIVDNGKKPELQTEKVNSGSNVNENEKEKHLNVLKGKNEVKYRFFGEEKYREVEKLMIPNHRLAFAIEALSVEPYVSQMFVNKSLPELQAETIFPENFTLHIHHLDSHIKSDMKYVKRNSLSQNSSASNLITRDQKIENVIIRSIVNEDSRVIRKQPNGQKNISDQCGLSFQFHYDFRDYNLDLYQSLLSSDQQYQKMVFTIEDTATKLVYGIGKLNFHDLVLQKISESRSIEKVITVQVKKMISFDAVIPLEEMPPFCKFKFRIKSTFEVLCPEIVENISKIHFFKKQHGKDVINEKNSHQILNKSPRKVYFSSERVSQEQLNASIDKSPHRRKNYTTKITEKSLEKISSRTRSKNHTQSKSLYSKPKMVEFKIFEGEQIFLNIFQAKSTSHQSFPQHIFKSRKLLGEIEHLLLAFQHDNKKSSQVIFIEESVNLNLINCQIKPQIVGFYGDDTDVVGEFLPLKEKLLFSLTVKAKLTLKQNMQTQQKHSMENSRNFGQLYFRIQSVFLEKLNKILETFSEDEHSSTFEPLKRQNYCIVVQPNHLFKIEQSGKKTFLAHTKNSKQNQIGLNQNRLLRLSCNIYVYPSTLYHNDCCISKNHHMQKLEDRRIHQYAFKLNFEKESLYSKGSEAEVSIFPFGTAFKILKSQNNSCYVIHFKVHYQEQYLYYKKQKNLNLEPLTINSNALGQIAQALERAPHKTVQEKNTFLKNRKSIKIQMAIALTLNQTPKNSTEKVRKKFNIQYFDCQLCIDSEHSRSDPYRQVEVNESSGKYGSFISVQLSGLVKQNRQLQIQSCQSATASVVNGQNFVLCTRKPDTPNRRSSDELFLMIHKKIQPGYYNGTLLELMVDDWAGGQTNSISIYLLNRLQSKAQQNVESSDSNEDWKGGENTALGGRANKLNRKETKFTFRL